MQAKTILAALGAALLLMAGAGQAQPAAPAASGARGPGMGPGMGSGGPRGGWGPHFGNDYTPGWGMMSPAERDQHRQRMLAAKSPEECRRIIEEHRKWMSERAKDRGTGPLAMPRHDACGAAGS